MLTNSPIIILGKKIKDMTTCSTSYDTVPGTLFPNSILRLIKQKVIVKISFYMPTTALQLEHISTWSWNLVTINYKLTYPGNHLWRDNHRQVFWHSVFCSVLSTDPVMAPIIQHKGVSGKLVKTNPWFA